MMEEGHKVSSHLTTVAVVSVSISKERLINLYQCYYESTVVEFGNIHLLRKAYH